MFGTRTLLPLPAIAVAALPAPLLAADADDYARALDAAMASMRIYLTCSALDPETHAFVREYWSKMVVETVAWLADAGVAPANLEAFRLSAEPDGLMPAPQTSFAEVRTLCLGDADWMARLSAFDLPQLPQALADIDKPDGD